MRNLSAIYVDLSDRQTYLSSQMYASATYLQFGHEVPVVMGIPVLC